MSQIMTVLGPIKAETLGMTTMHDHVLAHLTPFFISNINDEQKAACPINVDKKVALEDLCYLNELGLRAHCEDNWDLSDVEFMKKEVAYFKQRGGKSILEPSAPGIRTNIIGTRDISRATGVNIIASTGLYVEVSWPAKFKNMDEGEFRDYLIKEIEVGIDNSDVKAGHIKAGIRVGTDEELKFFKTTAKVSREKNLLVTAHTSRGTHPAKRRKMLHLLLDSGINPDKLLLCHIHFTFWEGDFISYFIDPTKKSLQLEWAREVMDQGVNICVDLFGEQPGPWNSVRLAGLITLLEEGYGNHIVIGNDVYQKTMTRSYGGFGYCSMLDYAIPELKNYGISQATIDKITVNNPIRMLQF